MTFQISETTDLDACLALRRVVFIEEQNVPEDLERDELDTEAVHFLALLGDVPVATARLYIQGSTGKIGRVCVLPEQRGKGLGADLIRATLDYLRDKSPATQAKLGSQSHATTFYERLGFTVTGPEYQDAGIAHFDMIRPV